MSDTQEYRLPKRRMVMAVNVPEFGIDVLSTLYMLPRAVAAGRLDCEYDSREGALSIRNMFNGFGGIQTFWTKKAESCTLQHVPPGLLLVDLRRLVTHRGPERWIIAECDDAMARRLDGYCDVRNGSLRLDQVLPATDAICEELRNMVGKTPIRI